MQLPTDLFALKGQPQTSPGQSEVVVRVGQIPPNQAPVVNAGPDLTGNSGQTLVLNGTVTDEGLPAGVLYAQWNVLSGPAPASFSAPGQPHTMATFVAPGIYVLRLSATDGELTATDETTVTIVAGTNQAPVVAFGGPRSMAYGQTLTLTPTITDDGLPTGILTLDWRQTGGPAALQVVPQADGSARVSASAAGVYHLLLSASDGALSGSDEVAITVTPVATVPPVVAVTAPAGGANFARGQTVTLQAVASDPDAGGSIVAVSFYDGATLLGTDPAPDAAGHAQFRWTGAAAGSHSLTARATDVSGTTGTSAPIALTVTPARPNVVLSYPVAYSAFAPGEAVQVQATASPGGDGSALTQVEFLVNGSVIGVDPNAPYGSGWTAPAAPGEYTFQRSSHRRRRRPRSPLPPPAVRRRSRYEP